MDEDTNHGFYELVWSCFAFFRSLTNKSFRDDDEGSHLSLGNNDSLTRPLLGNEFTDTSKYMEFMIYGSSVNNVVHDLEDNVNILLKPSPTSENVCTAFLHPTGLWYLILKGASCGEVEEGGDNHHRFFVEISHLKERNNSNGEEDIFLGKTRIPESVMFSFRK